ncbi:MAG: SelB C-terminal domain-containing protein, partial [Chloroflexota bacterium]
LEPGNEAFIQLKLVKPVVAVRGDRYILRRPSPSETLGGGVVLDPHPEKIHKRFNKQTLISLNETLNGDSEGILIQTTERLSAPTIDKLLQEASLSPNAGLQIVNVLLDKGLLISLSANTDQSASNMRIMTQAAWLREAERVTSLLTEFHQESLLREGMPREALRAKLNMDSGIFELIVNKLARESKINVSGTIISLENHKITLSNEQKGEVKDFFQKFNAAPFNPPGFKESQELLGEDLLNALILTDRLIRVSDDIIFTPDAYQQMGTMVKERLYQNGSISLTELRDHFQTSRRFALALLEHLDSIGITVRQGDLRILKDKSI